MSANDQRPKHYVGHDEAQEPQEKPKKRSNLLSNLLIVVGLALLVVAGVIWYNNMNNYRQIDEKNERVAEYAKLSDDGSQPPSVDWEALKAMNPDIVGWLQVPGTIVNYPVFKAADNEYYLYRAPDRSPNDGGSIFLDYQNTAPGIVEQQTIVFGHHMKNGVMFKQVADFNNQAFFDAVPTVWYCTPQATYRCAPLCLYYAEPDDQTVRRFSFETNEDYAAYLSSMLAKAVTRAADAEVRAAALPQIFTLCTCNYIEGQGRSVLVCTVEQTV
jgi:sortase B